MFLHSAKKVHRQIRADRLRLDHNREIYLGDFGLAWMVAPKMSYLNGDHCAVPEVFRSEAWDAAMKRGSATVFVL
jgi:serine/threonine protein kinase